LLYFLFLAVISFAGFLRPARTFDRLLYAATVASFRYSDPSTIHAIARQEFDREPERYVADAQYTEYTNAVLDDPQILYNHVWLFKIKAGYVYLGYVLWRLGFPILAGLRLISAASLFLLGVLVLAWTNDELASGLLMLVPPILNTGRMVTADPLSTLAIIAVLLCWWRKRLNATLFLMLVAVVVRTDNVVLGILLVGLLLGTRTLSLGKSLAAVAVLVATALSINHFSGYYGWGVVMYHSFVHPILDPVHHLQRITLAEYFQALRICALQVIYSPTPVFAFMWLVAWRRSTGLLKQMLALAAVWSIVRLLMFPNPDERFFVWVYVLVGITVLFSSPSLPTNSSRTSAEGGSAIQRARQVPSSYCT
jgi:hypothetical protein